MVAGTGLEPATSGLWARRATNCSTPRHLLLYYAVFSKIWRKPATYQKMIGAGDRGRTGTIGKDRRILSPVRLPIPPLRQAHSHFVIKMAPREGLEPSTLRLTAACSTIELPRNTYYQQRVYHRQHKSLYPYQGKMSSIFFKYFTSVLFFISYNPCSSSQSVYISGACKAYVRENREFNTCCT